MADNGSSDGSTALVRDWALRMPGIPSLTPWVRGPSAARNVGIRSRRGELLAFCDADDIVHAGWIAGCADALRDADVVGGAFDLWTLNGSAEAHRCRVRAPARLPAGGYRANMAVRRSAFEAVGGFGEDVQPGEDIDLCWRLQSEGFRFAVAMDVVVPYGHAPASATTTARR